MDIIILDRDVKYSIKLMKEISGRFKDYRVVYITDDENDFKEYVKSNFFDVFIMEEFFIDRCPEVFKYKVHKICMLEEYKQQIPKYIGVSKKSKRALYDNLSKILTKSLDTNENVRKRIRKELDYLGYNFSLRGTKYLEDAISLIYLKNCECNLEREVYSQLSKTYMKTSHAIKVNIQNSTNAMIDFCGYNKVLEYLDIDSYYGVGTKAIICAILYKLRKDNQTE